MDGSSDTGIPIAAFSGFQLPEPVVSTSNEMFLVFTSNTNLAGYSGFDIAYTISPCPFNCSANGTCDHGVCVCDSEYFGNGCQFQICPSDCSGNGDCDTSSGVCVCDDGYIGDDCSTTVVSPYWARSFPSSPLPLVGTSLITDDDSSQVLFSL